MERDAAYRELEKLLNPEQLSAATTTEGPLLVLAGAGSGKTRVLVHRIAYLIDTRRAEPWQIFAVTFTNKAAGEMRSRLEALIGPASGRAWIGTFHALSARMLRMEGERLGYRPSFTIYDDDDAKRLLSSISAELGIDTSSRGVSLATIASAIDRAKNEGETPEALVRRAEHAGDLTLRLAARIYPRYQDTLRRSNAMDFGDLPMLAVQLLRHHPQALDRFSGRFRYVLVDEFQDTNRVQYELLRLLVKQHENLAVVGDDDQAIYRWRGADVANILGFEDHFPGAQVVKLERNYRSTANILAAANAVIRKNRRRHDKRLRTTAAAGAKVQVKLLERSEDEAAVVARLIAARIRSGERPESFAILYRQNAQSRLFEEELRRNRVPYVLIGGTGFYERREVKDVLAYLRLTANPASRQDFERVLNVPPRQLGEKTLERLRAAAADSGAEGARLLELPDAALAREGIDGRKREKLRALAADLAAFRALAEHGRASDVARAVIERTRYLEYLEQSEPASAEDRIANVQELVTSIAEQEEKLAHTSELEEGPSEDDPGAQGGLGLAGASTPLGAFLDSAALVSTADTESKSGAVSMLTLHGAKGLEFPYVFMVGMEEQTFPSKRAMEGGEEAMEEERRLCYVGMTRAMKELALLAARFRRIYGNEEQRWPSRFLGELPDEIVGDLQGVSGEGSRAHGSRFTRREAFSDLADPDAPALGRARTARAIERGGDHIEYDDEPGGGEPALEPAAGRRLRRPDPEPGDLDEGTADGGFRLGGRVHHNLFGTAEIEDMEGRGPNAKLTLRFGDGSVRRVIARFVRALPAR